MNRFNQVHIVNIDRYLKEYNPVMVSHEKADKWMRAMERDLPAEWSSLSEEEIIARWKQTEKEYATIGKPMPKHMLSPVQIMTKVNQSASTLLRIPSADAIDDHHAALFIIRHWKYRQLFAVSIGWSQRYEDILAEEKCQPLVHTHNDSVETSLLNQALNRQNAG